MDFYTGCDTSDVIRHHCVAVKNKKCFSIAQFFLDSLSLRDNVGKFGCTCILSRDELNCIIHYLAIMSCIFYFYYLTYFMYNLTINK